MPGPGPMFQVALFEVKEKKKKHTITKPYPYFGPKRWFII